MAEVLCEVPKMAKKNTRIRGDLPEVRRVRGVRQSIRLGELYKRGSIEQTTRPIWDLDPTKTPLEAQISAPAASHRCSLLRAPTTHDPHRGTRACEL